MPIYKFACPKCRRIFSFLLELAVLGVLCRGEAPASPSGSAGTNAVSPLVPVDFCQVANTWPHDRGAFTEGLVYHDGVLLESTGLEGQSSLRRVELKTGRVLQQVAVPSEYFAEGLTVLNGKLYQLTWKNHKGFVYDLATFRLEKTFSYDGEGWGLTTDGHSLILSDGTDQIRFLDPATFKVQGSIHVADRGRPIERLNELEYVRGEIFANIWQTDFIARIDPATGQVLGLINLGGLLPPAQRAGTDVLNGIAYDAAGDRLFVTGKWWPKLFEVRWKTKS